MHGYTVSGSSAIETCFLKLVIVAELTHNSGREFQLSMTLLLNVNFLTSSLNRFLNSLYSSILALSYQNCHTQKMSLLEHCKHYYCCRASVSYVESAGLKLIGWSDSDWYRWLCDDETGVFVLIMAAQKMLMTWIIYCLCV